MPIARPAQSREAEDARAQAEQALAWVEKELPRVRTLFARSGRAQVTAEARLADGELVMRSHDYERAIHLLEQAVELYRQGKASATVHADALWLLGESYLQDGQLLSAARRYRELLEHGAESPYALRAGRALSRLVDISVRARHPELLDGLTPVLERVPQSDPSGSLQYARAKALFARGDLSGARSLLGQVAADSPYYLQAQYHLGVVMAREALPEPADAGPPAAAGAGATTDPGRATLLRSRLAPAIEQFRKVTRMVARDQAQRHVVDLAWMALGRLFYQVESHSEAADAYSHVDRSSPEFSAMLYELAWVFIALGDQPRAQRALEVLSVIDPETLDLADSALVRADLMLRSGQFEAALRLYQEVRRRYDPLREQVESFLAETTDPGAYYDALVEEPSVSGRRPLPPMAVSWAREQAEDARVFSTTDDVARSHQLIRDSRRIGRLLRAALSSPARVKAFPELKAPLQATLGLLNRLALARLALAEGMDEVAHQDGSGVASEARMAAESPADSAELLAELASAEGELDALVRHGALAQVRLERRRLMRRMHWLPTSEGDFVRRDVAAESQWNRLSQLLQQLVLETDRLQAKVNGLRRVLQDADQFAVVRDPASRQRFAAELEANQRDLAVYQQRISQYREVLELGRAQVGLGDQRFVVDQKLRRRFRALLAREAELVARGQEGKEAAAYAASIQPLLVRMQGLEESLEPIELELGRMAVEKSARLQAQIEQELSQVELGAGRLEALDQEARLLVGEAARKNFALVRDRLKNLVTKADIGIVQQAWEVREEERIRVRNLLRERAREDRKLNDELREVLDDAAEEGP